MTSEIVFFKISHFHGTYHDWGKTPGWRFMFFDPFLQRKKIETYMD